MTLFTRSQLIRQWLPGTLGVVGALVLGACGGAPSTESTTVTTDTATGDTTLVVATEPAFPPFESQAFDGSLEGFDIDLMNAIGEAAGFTVEFESLPFDGIIPALQAGTIDAAISAMTITPERAETVSFSRPYFKAGLAIAVQDSTTDVTSLESLEGKRIAAQIGTTGASKANEIPGAEVRTFDSAPLALQELSNGNVDAVINDAPVTLYAIKEGGLTGLKVTGELLTEEFYGIAIPKDSENVALINEGLTTINELPRRKRTGYQNQKRAS
ncbi:MAG: basic amino acid ABC transporter substrate-binding protein, partial [Synechococcales cyanobacterium T60_A2020_003]|nr:basic amino acid ABC transporter substrate-binding protein [Synechococcales cyanobacterium T60_A2020_003]